MNPNDDLNTPPAAAAPRSTFEGSLERLARELLLQQRSERRWRIFFRLAWLG